MKYSGKVQSKYYLSMQVNRTRCLKCGEVCEKRNRSRLLHLYHLIPV